MKNKLPVKILAILLSCGLLTVGVGAALALQPADAAPPASAATKEVAKAAGVTLHTLYKYITFLGGTKIDNKFSSRT